MPDVFGRKEQTVDSAFSADSSSLTFEGGGGEATTANLLTQNLSVNYGQTTTRIYELGSQKSSMIQGRTQGTVSLSRIIGPAVAALDFITKFSNVCNIRNNNIVFRLDASEGDTATGGGVCSEGSKEGFTAYGCLIQNLSYSVEAQDLIIRQQVQMQIISLNQLGVEDAPVATPPAAQ